METSAYLGLITVLLVPIIVIQILVVGGSLRVLATGIRAIRADLQKLIEVAEGKAS